MDGKGAEHHARRLLARMMQAETATTRSEAQRIVRKAKKHQRKLSRLRRMIRGLFGGGDG